MTSGRSTCDGPFTMDDSGNRDSVNPPRRGNNVDDAIDNLTNRYDSSGEKMTGTAIDLQKELAQS